MRARFSWLSLCARPRGANPACRLENSMKILLVAGAAAALFGVAASAASAAPVASTPFIAHQAAYALKLGRGNGMKAPASVDGLILYRFSGSACAGYATTFRQVTRFEQSEGPPRTNDERVTTLEDPAKGELRFQTNSGGAAGGLVAGSAKKGAGGALDIRLTKPA
ncbi:MAG: DUF1849 family protein, partial [Hyphomicrobiales bacterium]|nr:DUF1849 family protein [Hyphomicrobiales bacterium]